MKKLTYAVYTRDEDGLTCYRVEADRNQGLLMLKSVISLDTQCSVRIMNEVENAFSHEAVTIYRLFTNPHCYSVFYTSQDGSDYEIYKGRVIDDAVAAAVSKAEEVL